MSDSSSKSKSNFVAWFAIGCGVVFLLAVGFLLFGGLFWSVSSSAIPASSSPAHTAPTPTPAPAPAPTSPASGEQR